MQLIHESHLLCQTSRIHFVKVARTNEWFANNLGNLDANGDCIWAHTINTERCAQDWIVPLEFAVALLRNFSSQMLSKLFSNVQ